MLEVADCVELWPRIPEIAESASELSCIETSTSRAELLMLEADVLAASSGKSRLGLALGGCSVIEGGEFSFVVLALKCAVSAPWESILLFAAQNNFDFDRG